MRFTLVNNTKATQSIICIKDRDTSLHKLFRFTIPDKIDIQAGHTYKFDGVWEYKTVKLVEDDVKIEQYDTISKSVVDVTDEDGYVILLNTPSNIIYRLVDDYSRGTTLNEEQYKAELINFTSSGITVVVDGTPVHMSQEKITVTSNRRMDIEIPDCDKYNINIPVENCKLIGDSKELYIHIKDKQKVGSTRISKFRPFV